MAQLQDEFLITATARLQREKRAWLEALAHERRLSGKTVEAYERDLRQFLAFLTRHLAGPPDVADVAALRPADLRAFLADRRRNGAGARSLGRGLAGIRSFLRHLERKGLANAAGARALRAPKQPKSLPKPLTSADALSVVDARGQLAEEPWIAARNAAVLTLLYGCGLRISEALGLRPPDMAQDSRSLRVTGKGGKMRIVPLLPAAREAVETYKRLCPWHLAADAALFRGAARRAAATGDHPARDAEDAVRPRPAGYGDPACAEAFLRDPSAGGRRRPEDDSGASRPCQPVDDAGLYRRRQPASSGNLRQGAPARLSGAFLPWR